MNLNTTRSAYKSTQKRSCYHHYNAWMYNFFSDKTIFRLWVRCYTYFWHQKLFDHFLQSLGNTLLCRFLGPNSQIFYGLHSSSLRCSRQTNDFGVAGGLAIIKNPINLIAENATFIIILSESTFLRMRTWFAPAGLDQITHKSFPLCTTTRKQ